MTFKDIFKSGFLEKVQSLSLFDMVVALLFAFALGLFIYFIYRKTFNGVMYSSGFGVSLIALTMITTVVILAVTSNVVLSLGMVGALSIVRFRTAIKEPLDIAFLFWSIAVGIITGAGLLPLAVISSVLIGVILVTFVNRKSRENPYILVVHCSNDASEKKVTECIGQSVKKRMVKSKTVSRSGIELTVEVRLQDQGTDFINRLYAVDGVSNAILVSYNGEYMG